jgi:DNA-binding CsgD family transcriptional regulator
VGNLVASELYDRSSQLCEWLLDRAISRLPECERTRYREEWYAHLENCPGKLGRLAHAFGCYVAASRVTDIVAQRQRAAISKSNNTTKTAADSKKLTARERDCLEWLEYGKSPEDIGVILCIPEKAVRIHLKRVENKLGKLTR